MPKAHTVESLIQSLTFNVEFAKARTDSFAEKFKENPAYTLEWSSDVFANAAELQVYSYAIECLKGDGVPYDQKIAELTRIARETVARQGRSVPSSTSTPSNLIGQHVTAQWVRLWSYLEGSNTLL